MNLELNITRWVYASITTVFYTRCAGRMPIYLEGQERNTQSEADYFELRVNGPYINQLNSTDYSIDVDIDVLISSQISGHDLHKIYRSCGIAYSCLKDPFPIYKYGDGPDDDQSILECLVPMNGKDEFRITHFGKADPVKQLMRSSIEGHYHTFLNGIT